MSGKNILIIEADETVKNIIKKSILGFDPTSTIDSAPDGLAAMQVIQEKKFDCLIIDAEMILTMGETGFTHFRKSFKDSIQVVITGYSSSLKDLPKSIQESASVVSKPIDQRSLSPILAGIIGPLKTEILQQDSLSSIQYQFCQEKLLGLRHLVSARCIFLSDSVGRILVSAGNTSDLAPELMTSLLGGGIATLQEAGKALMDDALIHLIYREGKKTDLYAVNIGVNFLIIIIIDKTAGFSKLGSIWYYARQTALTLLEYLSSKTNQSNAPQDLTSISSSDISDELDRLFKQ